jgi:hypothetical protein
MKHIEFLKKCQITGPYSAAFFFSSFSAGLINSCSETESVASQLDSREAVLKKKEIVALDLKIFLDLLLSLSLHSKSIHKIKEVICSSLRDVLKIKVAVHTLNRHRQ